MGQKYRKTEDQKPWPNFSRNQEFAAERGLNHNQGLKCLDQEDALSELVYLKRIMN